MSFYYYTFIIQKQYREESGKNFVTHNKSINGMIVDKIFSHFVLNEIFNF